MTAENTTIQPKPSIAARARGVLANTEGVLKNIGWMLVGEGMARASRLVTIIALAALLPAAEYGLVMLALVCHELMRVLTRIGSGAKLIQCADQDLLLCAGNAYTLNWLICLSVAAIQYFSAPLIANFYSSPEISRLLCIMSFSYLIYPIVAIKVYLLQRDNQMKFYSLCCGLSITVDNLSTALLVFLGFGIDSVAYAKILAALVWVIAFSFGRTPSFTPQCSPAVIKTLMQFSFRVLGSEVLKMLRNQTDVLVAGRILSPELFGLYSFAKSAGIGLSQSLSNAFIAGIYPRLANLQRLGQLNKGSKITLSVAAVISLIFIAQSLAANLYIPLLFDAQWHDAATLVSILCLSAIPALLLDTSALITRVQYRLNQEIALQMAAVILLMAGLLTIRPDSPASFALTTTSLTVGWVAIAVIALIYNNRINPNFLRSTA